MPKLECKIRRKGGTENTMPNPDGSRTTYHFKPVDPTRADSPHVAEVDDQAHYDRFLSVAPECYVPFDGKAPKVHFPKPGTAPQPAAVEVQAGETIEHDLGDRVQDKAAPHERLSVSDLSAGIVAGKFTPEQLREMLAAEEESGSPRKNFVKAITQALK